MHASYEIWKWIVEKRKKKVIVNIPINKSVFLTKRFTEKKLDEKLFVIENKQLTPKYLIDFALEHNKSDKEGETLLVIDEAADIFNREELRLKSSCFDWRRFFREHGHLGYEIILICQNKSQLDRQIVSCIEYEVNHRNAGNFKKMGKFMKFVTGGFFSYVVTWIATKPSQRISGGYFRLNRKKAKMYNTHQIFADRLKNKG